MSRTLAGELGSAAAAAECRRHRYRWEPCRVQFHSCALLYRRWASVTLNAIHTQSRTQSAGFWICCRVFDGDCIWMFDDCNDAYHVRILTAAPQPLMMMMMMMMMSRRDVSCELLRLILSALFYLSSWFHSALRDEVGGRRQQGRKGQRCVQEGAAGFQRQQRPRGEAPRPRQVEATTIWPCWICWAWEGRRKARAELQGPGEEDAGGLLGGELATSASAGLRMFSCRGHQGIATKP